MTNYDSATDNIRDLCRQALQKERRLLRLQRRNPRNPETESIDFLLGRLNPDRLRMPVPGPLAEPVALYRERLDAALTERRNRLVAEMLELPLRADPNNPERIHLLAGMDAIDTVRDDLLGEPDFVIKDPIRPDAAQDLLRDLTAAMAASDSREQLILPLHADPAAAPILEAA